MNVSKLTIEDGGTLIGDDKLKQYRAQAIPSQQRLPPQPDKGPQPAARLSGGPSGRFAGIRFHV